MFFVTVNLVFDWCYRVKSQKILFGINNTYEKHETHEQNIKNMVNIHIIV